MRLRGLLALSLVVVLIFSTYSAVFASAADEIKVRVNNRQLKVEVSVTKSGTVMVPGKELMESLGGKFSFSSGDKTASARVGENQLDFRLDDAVAGFNGKLIKMDAPFQILNNRLMIPAVSSASRLGAEAYFSTYRNTLMVFQPQNGKIIYEVMSGDTLWIISQLFGTTIANLRQLNGITGDMIYVGQKMIIKDAAASKNSFAAYTTAGATIRTAPGFDAGILGYLGASAPVTVTGKVDGWYRVDTSKGSGYIYYTVIGIKQELSYGTKPSTFFDVTIPVDTSADSVTYKDYTVVKGEYIWLIANKNGIPDYELVAANNFAADTVLQIGQKIKIPVHNIAVKNTPGPQYGEILDWYSEAQYVFPIGKTGKVTDPVSGKSFNVKRTMGSGHADTETVTYEDTKVLKEIFGGAWSWERKALILEVDGRKLAVSITAMPHAGVDGAPYLQNVNNRSGDYGTGPNYDSIPGNGMDGHFDLYFLNCRRHMDNQIDPQHQYEVMKAGGLR